METWAANTLRTLGIILTAGFVLIATLFLLLLSMCSFSGGFEASKNPSQGYAYLIAAVMVVVAGIWFIAWLARGISRASAGQLAAAGAPSILAPGQSAEPSPTIPLHLSPLSHQAIDRLIYALIAQIVLSAFAWIVGQLNFWSAPRTFRPHNWTLILLIPFILYHIPYALLIYYLQKNLNRRTLTYALVVPGMLILQSLFTLSLVTFTYIHNPAGFLLIFIPWALDIVVFYFAWKAIQQVGIHPDPPSLVVAAVVTFIYFFLLHVITPLLYRMAWR